MCHLHKVRKRVCPHCTKSDTVCALCTKSDRECATCTKSGREYAMWTKFDREYAYDGPTGTIRGIPIVDCWHKRSLAHWGSTFSS